MKKLVIIILGALCFQLSFSQEAGKYRVGLETGFFIPHDGGWGFPISLEGKYNIEDNMNIGIRGEYGEFIKNKSYSAKVISFTGTYDYYYSNKNKLFSPFVGAGIGYYFCDAYDYSQEPGNEQSKYSNPTAFIRTGFEIGKFRTFLSYNLIRKHNEANYFNRNSDYISLNIGFYIGGGKWKK